MAAHQDRQKARQEWQERSDRVIEESEKKNREHKESADRKETER